MALSLREVPPSRGARWVRDGFRLFTRHPLPFSFMFVVFLAAVLIGSALSMVFGTLVLCAVPLLGLGFMVAGESALAGGPIHPGQFITPLRQDARRRRHLLILCAAFGLSTVLVLWLAHVVDGGALGELQQLQMKDAPAEEIEALVSEPRFTQGLMLRLGGTALLSLPFWHAPALIHWGGQGPGQALFSSLLALWRTRGAFVVYLATWTGVVALFAGFTGAAMALLGVRQMAGLVIMPALLIFSTVFYVSLLFTFADSFDGSGLKTTAP